MLRRFLAFWIVACAALGAPVQPGALPGTLPYPAELQTALHAAWEARPAGYRPRARHLDDAGQPRYLNRLFLETSPYLRQHAHNPVDWRRWGDEAFEEARQLGRPILLSVGYSTCHWCHVMEDESFEDLEIAERLNRDYIPIKVDREERPDIDAFYMGAVALLTGGAGGWPMTLWLTPDRKPYYAASYLPPGDGDRGARFGFLTLLGKMREVYESSPDTVAHNAEALTQRIQQLSQSAAGEQIPGDDALDRAARHYRQRFDSAHGGLEGAPKFPSDLPVRFLLRRGGRDLAERTLEAMARGGVHDHVGGGFHRYTVDGAWRIPHFEKMLYDNALLVRAYLEGHQATGRQDFVRVARRTLDYLASEMSRPGGGFYSATDADSRDPATSERVEGRLFTWTRPEIEAALGAEEARAFLAAYPLAPDAELDGRFVLNRVGEPAQDDVLRILVQARAARPQPFRDEKIVASWNGLAISAFAFAALVLDEPAYASRAERAADFVLSRMRPDGRLARSYHAGRTSGHGFLDDHAFLVAGLLDLYEATSDLRRLEQAIELDREVEKLFEDPKQGGFHFASADSEALPHRPKPIADSAEPSGNSVHILNLMRLHEFTTRDGYRQRAERALRAFASTIEANPAAVSELLLAVAFRTDGPLQILVVAGDDDPQPLLDLLRKTFIPSRVLAAHHEDELAEARRHIPLLEGKRAIGGRSTVYVCRERVCKLPVSDPGALREVLDASAR